MIKQFKNRNLHIKFEDTDIGSTALEKLCLNYDMYPVGDEYCISNYATAIDVCYNGGSDYYTVTSYDLHDLESGKEVILQPLTDDYIQEIVKEFYGDECIGIEAIIQELAKEYIVINDNLEDFQKWLLEYQTANQMTLNELYEFTKSEVEWILENFNGELKMKTYNWQHIQFKDGSNPYICTTEEAFEYMDRKYKLTKIKEGFWLAEDKSIKLEYETTR